MKKIMKTVSDKAMEILNSIDDKDLKEMIINSSKDYCDLFEKHVAVWIVSILSIILNIVLIILYT